MQFVSDKPCRGWVPSVCRTVLRLLEAEPGLLLSDLVAVAVETGDSSKD